LRRLQELSLQVSRIKGRRVTLIETLEAVLDFSAEFHVLVSKKVSDEAKPRRRRGKDDGED
jgi:hypothetical protein